MQMVFRLIAALRQAHADARDRRLFNRIWEDRAARRGAG